MSYRLSFPPASCCQPPTRKQSRSILHKESSSSTSLQIQDQNSKLIRHRIENQKMQITAAESGTVREHIHNRQKMTEDLKRHIQETIRSVPGVRGVVIADRDGVPILRIHDDTVPETVMRPAFLSSVGFATDQASRLGYGKANYVISIHERHQMVHFNLTGIILTIIADVDSNTGMLLTLSNELTDVTDTIRNALQLAS